MQQKKILKQKLEQIGYQFLEAAQTDDSQK